ncbi:MAG: hypothetical protein HC828_02325 [Blastochloris sp.]|nr:hypothetical protein [Blastochloris sp.]
MSDRMTEAELQAESTHVQQLLDTLHRRRRHLEQQRVQQGSHNAEPQLQIRLEDSIEEIKQYEAELHRLNQRVAAQSYERTVEEVEYRMLVADTWADTLISLSVVDQARLEWAQVRLGIPSERARALEREIRIALTNEVLANIDRPNMQRVLARIARTPPEKHALDTAVSIDVAHRALGNDVGVLGIDYSQFFGDVQHLIRAMVLDGTTTSTWVGFLLHEGAHTKPAVQRLERALRLTAQEPVYRPYQERIAAAITDLVTASEHT